MKTTYIYCVNCKEVKVYGECGHDQANVSKATGSNFEPHFSPEIGQMVYSWADAERKGKAFRSPDHPNGFVLTQSNSKFLKELRDIRRNKEDYVQQQYKKEGISYKPGITKKHPSEMMVIILFLLSMTTCAFAIDAQYTQFKINGVDYDVPIPNKDTRDDFYYLHKALDGDKYSRDLLLAGKKEKYIYIGDLGVVRWLILTENDAKVVEYKQ